MSSRSATVTDAGRIAEIFNEGIEDRIATFQTRPRTAADIAMWFDGVHPIIVLERDGQIVGYASTSTYRDRDWYAGIAEFSVYVAREERGAGVGTEAMLALVRAAEEAGFWKLVSRVFVDNRASRQLMARVGFREVGTYRRHSRLDGEWRDVVIVELLILDRRLAEH